MGDDNNLIPLCSKCDQVLRNPEFPKCMYCGHPIPEKDRLPKSEAKKLLQEKEDIRQKQADEERRKSEGEWGYKAYRESGGNEENNGVFIDLSGFGSGD